MFNIDELIQASNLIADEMTSYGYKTDAIKLKEYIQNYITTSNKNLTSNNDKIHKLANYMIQTISNDENFNRHAGNTNHPLHYREDDTYTYYYPLIRGNPSWWNTWYNYSTPYFWWLPSGFSIVL